MKRNENFLGVFLLSILMMVLYLMFVLLSYKGVKSAEAMSVYECGFEPGSLTRGYFSYRFFLIAILFIIFDVEISMMLPVPYMLSSMTGGWVFFLFVFILLFGTLYEYYMGSLSWMK